MSRFALYWRPVQRTQRRDIEHAQFPVVIKLRITVVHNRIRIVWCKHHIDGFTLGLLRTLTRSVGPILSVTESDCMSEHVACDRLNAVVASLLARGSPFDESEVQHDTVGLAI